MGLKNYAKNAVDFIVIKDTGDGRGVNQWQNPDILPVLPQNRTFTTKTFATYWVSGGICASFWAMGGTAVADGLSAGLAIASLIIASIVCAVVAYYCGKPGTKYYLGFPMMSRVTFGMYGSYFIVVLKCFTNFIYAGIQSYWGGQSVHVILAAIFPTYHNMENTLPESANITTADLIGTIIYMVFFFAILCIQPYKLNTFFLISFIGCIATITGMLIWAMAANGGPGSLVTPATHLSTGDTVFVFIQVMCVLCGSFTGSSIRHSDWSRYAATPRAPLLGIWVAGPLAVSMAAIFGVLVTSATAEMYGEIYWQPITLLLHIQSTNYSAGVRAGTFFAGLGWFMSQLAVNVSLNAVSAGMDLTSVAPKILNARRGSLMLAVIGIAICPWNYVNSASTFTKVLSSFGLFVSPLIGMYIADFWIIRHQNWKVPDLYVGNSSSAYWFTGGFNIRAFATWISIIWMSLPGFANAVGGFEVAKGWKRIFQITFFVGLVGGFVLYTIIGLLFPMEGARIHEDYVPSNVVNDSIEGKEVDNHDDEDDFSRKPGANNDSPC